MFYELLQAKQVVHTELGSLPKGKMSSFTIAPSSSAQYTGCQQVSRVSGGDFQAVPRTEPGTLKGKQVICTELGPLSKHK